MPEIMIRMQSPYVLLLLIWSNLLYSQQDPQYTQYMFNTMSINPAYSGSRGHGVVTILGRSQWVGMEGAPKTQVLGYDTPIGMNGIGLGINFINDVVGPSSEIHFDTNISYSIQTGEEGNLAFGMKLGGRFLSVDWSKGLYRDKADMQLAAGINKFLPTIGAGVYYYSDTFYIGASIPNLLRTEHYDDVAGGGSVAEERMHYFFIAGYVFDLTENVKFKPAVLTKVVSGAPLSLDVSANFLFNEKFRAGVAWRWGDAISAMLGFQINRKMQIGYAYDLTTSNYSNYSSGSHELMLRYEFVEIERRLKCPRFF